MVDIQGTTIRITRGDSLDTTISIRTADGEPYVPSSGDVIRFAAGKDYIYPPILKKIIPNDSLELKLASEDTKRFAANKKPYKYDIEIAFASGDVDTFIKGDLYVLPEVG